MGRIWESPGVEPESFHYHVYCADGTFYHTCSDCNELKRGTWRWPTTSAKDLIVNAIIIDDWHNGKTVKTFCFFPKAPAGESKKYNEMIHYRDGGIALFSVKD